MAVMYKGSKIQSLFYKNKKISGLWYKGKRIYSSSLSVGTVLFQGPASMYPKATYEDSPTVIPGVTILASNVLEVGDFKKLGKGLVINFSHNLISADMSKSQLYALSSGSFSYANGFNYQFPKAQLLAKGRIATAKLSLAGNGENTITVAADGVSKLYVTTARTDGYPPQTMFELNYGEQPSFYTIIDSITAY